MSLPKRLPYPGLRAFTREESDLFFGRESSIDTMVDCLAADRFMAVLGPSGSGKSSLVRTGLLDALELGLLSRAGSHWKIADMHPGGQPMNKLAGALLSVRTGPPADQTELDLMTAYLRQGPRAVVEWASAGNIPDGYNLLLLVDQFEELFRYADYAQREEAEAFVATLLESSSARGVSIYVVLTMRSEYLGACATIEGLAERISAGLYLAPRMDRDECREAIEGPASVVGFKVENALVNRLLNDLGSFAPWQVGEESDLATRLARQADQLPLMQHVLNRLWLRASAQPGGGAVELKLAEYEQIGGLSGALDAHGAEVIAELGSSRLIQIERIFRALVSGSTPATAVRRPCRMSELIEAAGGRRDDVVAVVDAFRAAGCNFLRTTGESLSDHVIVDISHESLIRQWTPLREWLENEGRAGAAWRRLAAAEERYSKREGGLLTGLDLQNMAAWWESSAPTPSWAARHGGQFETVRKFLEESKRAEALRVEAEVAEQLSERRRLIRFAIGVSVALVIFVGLGIWNFISIRKLKATQAALAEKNDEVARASDALKEQLRVTSSLTKSLREMVEHHRGEIGASNLELELLTKIGEIQSAAKQHQETDDADIAAVEYRTGFAFETVGDAKRALDSYGRAFEKGRKPIADKLAAGQPLAEADEVNFLLNGCRYAWFLLDIGENKKGDAVLDEVRNLVGQREGQASSPRLLIAYARLENLESRDALDHKKIDEEKNHNLASFNLARRAMAVSNSDADPDDTGFVSRVYRYRASYLEGAEKERLKEMSCKIGNRLAKEHPGDLRSIKARSECLLEQAWTARGKVKSEDGEEKKAQAHREAAELIRAAEEIVEGGLQVDSKEQELLLSMATFENFLGNMAWDESKEANDSKSRERFAHAMSAKEYIVRALSGRTLFQSTTTQMKDLYNGCCKWLDSSNFPNPNIEHGFYKEIVEALTLTLGSFPNAPSFAYVAADASVHMADAARNDNDAERTKEAIDDLTKAIDLLDKSGTIHNIHDLSTWSDDFSTYCANYNERATLYASTGQLDRMVRDIKKMEELCKPALEKYPWDIYLRNSFRLNARVAGKAFYDAHQYDQAKPYLEYASHWVVRESSLLLADMYREGKGVNKDEQEANKLATLAAGQQLTSVRLDADYAGKKGKFTVYALDWPEEYPYKDKGIDDQVTLLKEGYNGTLPSEEIQKLRTCQKIAKEDKTPFARVVFFYYNFDDEPGSETNEQAKQQFEQAKQLYARARALDEQGRPADAVKAADDALALEPQSISILNLAENIRHDELFEYDKAFELNARRVKLGTGGFDFVEKHLTTSQFAGCADRAAVLEEATSKRLRLVMSTFEFACLAADHKHDAAMTVGRRLRRDVVGLEKVGWTFTGTRHFVSTSPAFADKAPQWGSLFQALEDGDEKKAVAALDALGVPEPDKK